MTEKNIRLQSITSRMNMDITMKKIESEMGSKPALNILDMIQPEQYVGEVFDLSYDSAIIQVNDKNKSLVGGIPSQCFLIASSLNKDSVNEIDYEAEESSIILLRVTGITKLPNENERERMKYNNITNASEEKRFINSGSNDPMAIKELSFGALQCSIVGTFFMEDNVLKFGSDLSNFYTNTQLKVYKPSGGALQAIVNYGISENEGVRIGKVRYSSTNRRGRGLSNVEVIIRATDMIAQKTAIFGMSRMGKSNTVKVIVKSLYQLRQKIGQRVGQLIFDVNGEYANDNMQDSSSNSADSLKNIWQIPVNGVYGSESDISIYGMFEGKNSRHKKLMKINFYDDDLLQIGKELLDEQLTNSQNLSSQYMKNFAGVYFDDLESLKSDKGLYIREERRRLVYKTLLYLAGYKIKASPKKSKNTLFSNDLLQALEIGIFGGDEALLGKNGIEKKQKQIEYTQAYQILDKYNSDGASYAELAKAFEILGKYIKDADSTYVDFNMDYIRTSTTAQNWCDKDLESLLEMFAYSNSAKRLAVANMYHNEDAKNKDYADMIYEDLLDGKLVIVDQALGSASLNRNAAERIMSTIFKRNNQQFSEGLSPTKLIVYIEEAHNLMPKGSEEDTTNIWARVAKEGAKFNIGLTYSTQEVSSIQKNILKNTANWFVSHLNNGEEIRALSDFYDFQHFSKSILQAEDKGFIRMKTISNKFVVPVQLDKFETRSE